MALSANYARHTSVQLDRVIRRSRAAGNGEFWYPTTVPIDVRQTSLVARLLPICFLAPLTVVCCASEPPPAPVLPVVVETKSEPSIINKPLPTPAEESAKILGEAKVATELRERCRLLGESVMLDATSVEAQLLRIQSRCTTSAELLAGARLAFARRPDVATAKALCTVGLRASSKDDTLAAARFLVKIEVDDALDALALGAKALSEFGEHEAAAGTYERLAQRRAKKGASADVIEARIASVIESARAGGKGLTVPVRTEMLATIEAAAGLSGSYGADWLVGRLLDGISELRNIDLISAHDTLKKLVASKIVKLPDDIRAVAIALAIEGARGGDRKMVAPTMVKAERVSERMHVPAARALLAVESRISGNCAMAKSHAFAHDVLVANAASTVGTGARFDGDLSWARNCEGVATATTLLGVKRSLPVDDFVAIASFDVSRARALLYAHLDTHPADASATLALADLVRQDEKLSLLQKAGKLTPNEPALALAEWAALAEGDKKAGLAGLVDVLGKSVEVMEDPRAKGAALLQLLKKPAGIVDLPLAKLALEACASPKALTLCAAPEWLENATAALRQHDRPALARLATGLSKGDRMATRRVRLDLVLAYLSEKERSKAEQLASKTVTMWSGPESNLAAAAVAHASRTCVLARKELAKVPSLVGYEADIARIEKDCP